jgi:hypothetical protein
VTIETLIEALIEIGAPSRRSPAMPPPLVFGGVRGEISLPPISVPLLSPDNQRVVAGHRTISLVWDGSKRPFTIVHKSPSGTPLLEAKSEDARETWKADLEPGVHSIEILDGSMQGVVAHFTVVPESGLPPRVSSAGDRQSSARRVADAVRLAMWEAPEWKFEAFLRLSTLDAAPLEVERVRRALERGDAPELGWMSEK